MENIVRFLISRMQTEEGARHILKKGKENNHISPKLIKDFKRRNYETSIGDLEIDLQNFKLVKEMINSDEMYLKVLHSCERKAKFYEATQYVKDEESEKLYQLAGVYMHFDGSKDAKHALNYAVARFDGLIQIKLNSN